MLVVIDGPEKAGKSTLAAALAKWWNGSYPVWKMGYEARIRKWGKLDDGRWTIDSVYRDALVEDVAYEGLTIWDRSWASEAVYGRLLNRHRRLAADPWLGEWLYGRGVALKFILGGPEPSVMAGVHDAEDLPVEASAEQRAFVEYGRLFGWDIIGHTDRDRLPLDTLVSLVGLKVVQHTLQDTRDPRDWCGPLRSPVVMVGEVGSKRNMVGGWLPFSSPYTTRYGRCLGDAALRVGWTNALSDQRGIFEHARLVIACGSVAGEWAKEVNKERGSGSTIVEQVYHPSALYRWGNLRLAIPTTEGFIRRAVGAHVDVGEPSEARGEPVNA